MPAMERAAKWEDVLVIMRHARARVSCCAILDLEELILVVQATAISQGSCACHWAIPGLMSVPAIVC